MTRAAILAPFLLAFVASCATSPPRPEDIAPPEAGPIDADEAADLARALEEEGVLLGGQERQALGLGGAEDGGAPGSGASRSATASLALRQRGGPATTDATTLRVNGTAGPLALSARLRRDAEGEQERGMSARLAAGPLEIGAGRGAWEHGFGLLTAAPGRRRGLDAGSSLGWARQGWTPEPATASAAALAGVVGALRIGPAGGMLGALRPARAANEAGQARVAALWLGDSRRELSVLALSGAMGRGASAWLRAGGGPTELALEAARWSAAPTGRPGMAWSAAVRHAGGRWRAEALAAGADGGAPSPLGRRPAALPGWDGAGWCVRIACRPAAATAVGALLAGGRERESGKTGPEERSRLRWELEWTGGPRAGWRGEVSLRSVHEGRSGWLDRSPWLPPASMTRDSRLQLAVRAAREIGPWRLKAGLKLLSRRAETDSTGASPAETRTLAEASCDLVPAAGWCVRAGLALAWGAPGDLQSVVTPVPGLVAARHWGAWSAERSVGLAGRAGPCRLAAALSLRRPDGTAARERAEWSVVASAGLR